MQQFGTRQPPEFEEKSSGGLKAVIVIFAIFLFALSGLMMGLAVGAFTRHKPTSTPSHSNVAQQKAQATPTQNVNIIALGGIGCPIITTPFTQMADGTTVYQLSATIVNNSTTCGKGGNPLKVSGITCKIWITNTTAASPTRDQLFPASNMQNAFPDEIQNALTFTNGQQVQGCSPTGVTTWSYKLSPTLKEGTYYLGVAADWQGQNWNWYLSQIAVKG